MNFTFKVVPLIARRISPQPVWPGMIKFSNFGNILQGLGFGLSAYFALGKILNLL